MAEQVVVLDSVSVGSEESFTMLNVPAEPAVTQQEQQFLLEQLRHLSSSGITGQEARRAIVQMFPDKQQKIKVSKAVRTCKTQCRRSEQHGSAAECPCVDRKKPMITLTLGKRRFDTSTKSVCHLVF